MFVTCMDVSAARESVSFLPPSSASGQHLVKLTQEEMVGLKFW